MFKNIIFFVQTLISTTLLYAAGLTTETGSTFNVNDGTLNVTDGNITNAGALKASTGSINLGGNWTNTGTYSGGTSGTVEFTGSTAATINSDNTFINFKCSRAGKQLSFETSKTQTISGILTLTGSSGNLIKLRSTTAGTQWKIDPKSTKNVTFLDVKDSNNLSATVINPSNSTDNGNNTNWFVQSTPTPTTTATSTSTPVATATPVATSTQTATPAKLLQLQLLQQHRHQLQHHK